MTEETVFEESSGNVFADLGLEDAEELFTRGKIGDRVFLVLVCCALTVAHLAIGFPCLLYGLTIIKNVYYF